MPIKRKKVEYDIHLGDILKYNDWPTNRSKPKIITPDIAVDLVMRFMDKSPLDAHWEMNCSFYDPELSGSISGNFFYYSACFNIKGFSENMKEEFIKVLKKHQNTEIYKAIKKVRVLFDAYSASIYNKNKKQKDDLYTQYQKDCKHYDDIIERHAPK